MFRFTRQGENIRQDRWAILLQLCCKFTSVSVWQKLRKYKVVWQRYCKNKRCNFFAPQCRMVEKSLRIWENSWTWLTDTQTPHDGIGRTCIASRGKNLKSTEYSAVVKRQMPAFMLKVITTYFPDRTTLISSDSSHANATQSRNCCTYN